MPTQADREAYAKQLREDYPSKDYGTKIGTVKPKKKKQKIPGTPWYEKIWAALTQNQTNDIAKNKKHGKYKQN